MTLEGRGLWLWLAAVFAASYAIDLGIYVSGGLTGQAAAPLLIGRMWIPGLFAILWTGKRGDLGLRRPPWGLAALAIAVPLLVSVLWFGGSLAHGAHLGLPAEIMSRSPGRGAQLEQQLAFAWAHPLAAMPVVLVLLVLGSATSTAGTLGEELGWRSTLQPELEKRWGVRRATLATGLIWGYWHLPIILMGYNFPDRPVFGALALMPAFCVCLAFPLAWLRRGGVWPCALMHGAVNTCTSAAVVFTGGRGISPTLSLLYLLAAVPFALALERGSKSRSDGQTGPASLR